VYTSSYVNASFDRCVCGVWLFQYTYICVHVLRCLCLFRHIYLSSMALSMYTCVSFQMYMPLSTDISVEYDSFNICMCTTLHICRKRHKHASLDRYFCRVWLFQCTCVYLSRCIRLFRQIYLSNYGFFNIYEYTSSYVYIYVPFERYIYRIWLFQYICVHFFRCVCVFRKMYLSTDISAIFVNRKPPRGGGGISINLQGGEDAEDALSGKEPCNSWLFCGKRPTS